MEKFAHIALTCLTRLATNDFVLKTHIKLSKALMQKLYYLATSFGTLKHDTKRVLHNFWLLMELKIIEIETTTLISIGGAHGYV